MFIFILETFLRISQLQCVFFCTLYIVCVLWCKWMRLKWREYLVHTLKIHFLWLPAAVLSTSLNSEAQEERAGENSLPHVPTYWAQTVARASRANSRRESEQIFPMRSRVFHVWNMWEALALSYFFHVFRILTFHCVFHEPVRGSQNAGRAVIYAAALCRLAHSQCGKIFSLRVEAPHAALFITLGLSIVLRAVGFSYIVWLYFIYLYIFFPLPYLDLLD